MSRAIHWFRNDLRLRDNSALIASAGSDELVTLFVLDDRLLKGSRAGAPRVRFLLDCLERLAAALQARGSGLLVRRGDPVKVVPQVLEESGATRISWNRDTSPYGRRRDGRVAEMARRRGVEVLECRDRVVFESGDLLSGVGRPYSVYTPYQRAWRRRFVEEGAPPQRAPRLPGSPVRLDGVPIPSAAELGFGDDATELPTGGEAAARRRLDSFLGRAVARYHEDRDRPAADGTSRLSPYLRFGAISVRDCIDRAQEAAAGEPRLSKGVRKWIDELIWRDFYAAILEAHPRVARGAYRSELDGVEWNEDPEGFAAWCQGRTGFPLVDAGMRQLAASGWMHNRVRMVVASFLAKDLLIDWRRGEGFFFRRLVDGDPASNNGGWQWSASTGTDAAPYFRIFNPVSQGRRYDPEGEYLRRWVPELAGVPGRAVHEPWSLESPPREYPQRILDHSERRELALERYRAALGDAR